jgi:uncharacterized protein YyaL (SSP411 family)
MTPVYTNALIHEKSPYLLQHAHNPVNWRAWNDETFRLAEEQDKPVFLSIGYATCHWCHVMEHESFEDEGIAALLNEHFIAVKVDREERPDVDAVYMAVCQAMTGHGGWPLSVFLTPDKRPFYVGTYFPKENQFNRPGFRYVLEQIAAKWRDDRDSIENAGNSILTSMRDRADEEFATPLNDGIFDAAFDRYSQAFDDEYGGFGGRPKFPSPHNLLFLLRYYRRTGNSRALRMAEQTLREMRKGGLFDHIGYGFHRYSTDSRWLLPHFEKMLYDQAMLALAYTEAYQLTGKALYGQTTREILAYVLRDMTAPGGGFYSAEDADSEGVEGKFYVWTTAELREVLGETEATLFAKVYRFEEDGNFAEEATGHKTGDNIPHLSISIDEYADVNDLGAEVLHGRLEQLRQQLFEVREQRVHPAKDDKILADWNGLMIAAMAKAGKALNNAEYTEAARRAFDFIMTSLHDADGQLLHRWRDGEAAIPAFLDDYAFLAWGALELYETTFEVTFLRRAQQLCDDALRLFGDDTGGFRQSSAGHEQLIVPVKEAYDGATPSGNSAMAFVLARLGKLFGNTEYLNRAHLTVQTFGKQITSYPIGFAQMLTALDFLARPTQEIVIAGSDETAQTMLAIVAEHYLPFAVIVHNDGSEELAQLVEFVRQQQPVNGLATAYICENYTCSAPLTSTDELHNRLRQTDSAVS